MTVSYSTKLSKVRDWFSDVLDILEVKGIEPSPKVLKAKEIVDRHLRERKRAVFIGQFTSGKTHLVNGIIGEQLLPESLQETTAIPTLVHYGSREVLLVPSEDPDTDGYEEARGPVKRAFLNLTANDENEILFRFIRKQDILVQQYPLVGKTLQKWEFMDLPGHASAKKQLLVNNRRQIEEADLVVVVVSLKQGLTDDLAEFLRDSISEACKVIAIGTFADLIPPGKRRDTITELKRALSEAIEQEVLIARASDEDGLRSGTWTKLLESVDKKAVQNRDSIVDGITQTLDYLNETLGTSSEAKSVKPSVATNAIVDRYEEILVDYFTNVYITACDSSRHSVGDHINPEIIVRLDKKYIKTMKATYKEFSKAKDNDTYDYCCIHNTYMGVLFGVSAALRSLCWRFQIGYGPNTKYGAENLLSLACTLLMRSSVSFKQICDTSDFQSIRRHFPSCDNTRKHVRSLKKKYNKKPARANLQRKLVSQGKKLRRSL